MATGRLESGQVQVRSSNYAPIQQTQIPNVDFVAGRVQAQGSATLAQALDRMSAQITNDAYQLRQQEGLQFAAENPLTQEQLDAARQGRKIDLGGNKFSAFGQAVQKARSLELAAHFEAEGSAKLIDIQARVEEGLITAEQAGMEINQVTNGLGKSLASVDGDAAYKFRANMATNGRSVLLAATRTELQRKKAERMVKFDMTYKNAEQLLELAATEDPENFEKLAQNFRENIAGQSAMLGDFQVQSHYSGKIEPSIRNAKIAAIGKIFTNQEYLKNPMRTLELIDTAQAGRHSAMLADLKLRDSDAVKQIRKDFMEYAANYRTMRDDEEKMRKLNNEKAASGLLIEYYTPGTSPTRKAQIGNQLARMNVLSIEQTEKFLDPSSRAGDKFVFADLKTKIVTGAITDPDQLKREAARTGMNGEQYSQLTDELLKGYNKDKGDARQFIRRAAGVPDVASTFASKDDQHKITKDMKINDIWTGLVDQYRADNPGASIPYLTLARQAADQYDKTDKADAVKAQARKKLENYVKELKDKGKVQEGFVIDENTSVDDLVKRGIIKKDSKNDDAGYIQKQIDLLRK